MIFIKRLEIDLRQILDCQDDDVDRLRFVYPKCIFYSDCDISGVAFDGVVVRGSLDDLLKQLQHRWLKQVFQSWYLRLVSGTVCMGISNISGCRIIRYVRLVHTRWNNKDLQSRVTLLSMGGHNF